MTTWQRRTRLVIAVTAIAFAMLVASRLRGRTPERVVPPVHRSDPKATIESHTIHFSQTNREHEEVKIDADTGLGYDDGSSKLIGKVRVVTVRLEGRTFTIAANEAHADKDKTSFTFAGDVQVSSSDGMVVRTETAAYTETDGMLRASGPVTFVRGRMSGTGVGVTYDKGRDFLMILDQAHMHMEPDAPTADRLEVTAGTAEFDRDARIIRFTRSLNATREFETMEAADGAAHLSEDEKHIERLDLRGDSRVSGTRNASGGLKLATGRDIDLAYSPDGRVMQHAAIRENAVIELSAEPGQTGSRILANTIDLSLSPDGSVLTNMAARQAVQLALPTAMHEPKRTITAATMDATGNDQHGLTGARFTGNPVEFRERGEPGSDLSRTAQSGTLEVDTSAGLGEIEQARFSQSVRFTKDKVTVTSQTARYDLKAETLQFSQSVRFTTEKVTATSQTARYALKAETLQFSQGVKFASESMTASAASALYALNAGTLQLRDSDAASPVPHMSNDRINIDGRRLDVTLDGPVVTASGAVSSQLKPAKDKHGSDTQKLPSMLKQDQPVFIASNDLSYDGNTSRATYTSDVHLWQGETKINAASIVIDDKSGNLTAAGGVTTQSTLLQERNPERKEAGKAGASDKVRLASTGSAKDFQYDDSLRRASYLENARIVDAQGDLSARRIDLYLKESGDEVDRAEAHEQVTLIENGRKTTGVDELKYFSEDERYELAGKPIHHVDACKREHTEPTLTLFKGTNKIIAAGGTETKSDGATCP